MYLFCQVIDRTRRTIQTRNNTSAEIVTYTIRDICDRRYYVDEYSPSSYFEGKKYVDIPVYVKSFQKRNGEIAYSFCVQQKLANLLRKVWASPLDSEQELRSACPVENIFDSEVQCHFAFVP